MWRYFKWGFWIVLVLTVGGMLHYTLPQRDIVRITGTYNRLTTVGENSFFYATPDAGTGESTVTRDIRFIEAVRPNGRVIVYRNEDTGWVWPPYFKYDSSNLQAEASNLKSPADAPVWVAVTHYGWRISWMSIYPNAVRLRVVDGPDTSLFPWVNIVILTALAFLLFMVRRMWLQFRERMIDPALEDMSDALARADARADAARANARTSWGRFKAWLGGLFRR
ncbi:MAG: DUF1523 family protein [Rhodobacter sp.]|nr:DUF1523 family protein [Rhodobacter sp.]MCA3458923.1 DUF1523 family protein [Rhodobacter sp.]MCA3462303.1 DUF1523 family protein [Rhodobacter sp.]MCA3463297.1 DUF1523 family protein [Rhodobacter sp.]MCA3468568.1 DUF1523 family protein [Rhodobacter sp.]